MLTLPHTKPGEGEERYKNQAKDDFIQLPDVFRSFAHTSPPLPCAPLMTKHNAYIVSVTVWGYLQPDR